MTRRKGTFEMESNVEVKLQAPLDARLVVPNKSDLTDATNFPFAYIGMVVSVQSEGMVYLLTGEDTTDINNWKALGEGTTITIDDVMSDTSENAVQNKVITAALKDKADVADIGKAKVLTSADYDVPSGAPTSVDLSALPSGTYFLASGIKYRLSDVENDRTSSGILAIVSEEAQNNPDIKLFVLIGLGGSDLVLARKIASGVVNEKLLLTRDDIADNLISGESWKVLSAKQGKILKELIDTKQDKLTAGENITITYDATTQETTIASTGGSGGTVGEDITTNIAVGGLASGSSIDKDDTITSVLKRMLVTTYYPTFTPPSASITYSAPALAKVGSNIAAMAANVVFNAGAIMLQGTKQADRAGAATNYSIATSGAATEYSDSNTTGSFSMPALTRNSKGNITITGTVNHEAGPQPKDSDGNDYGSPLAAGSVTATKTVEFILPFYFGVSNTMTVTDFTGFTEVLEKKGQKQYTYVTNNQHFVIAYDASYGDLTSILDPNNFETKSSWTKSSLTVDGQQYNVYVAQTLTTNPGAKYTFKF